MPDPKGAVAAYAEAAARGDADAIYEMMSDKGRRALSRDEVRRIVADEKAELADQGKAVTAPGVVVKSRARVRFADGEDATLVVGRSGRVPHRRRRRAPRGRAHARAGARRSSAACSPGGATRA